MNLKRGFYIYYTFDNNFIGVNKKVKDQLKVFSKYFDFKLVIVKKEKSNFLKSMAWRLPLGSYGRNYEDAFNQISQPDFIYIRFAPVDRRYLKFIKELRDRYPSAKLLLEIATYPYSRELLKNFEMFPFYFKDIIYRRKLKKYIDRIVTFSKDNKIFGISTIQSSNGIIVDDQKMVCNEVGNKDVIQLLAVAMFQKYHGYERILYGLKNYYSHVEKRKIILHMVGEGPELKKYKDIVDKEKLGKYVVFHGSKVGLELDDIYNKVDIALTSFGFYKTGVYCMSVLKSREALAKGLPIVNGCTLDIFENEPCEYSYDFPNNNSIVDMHEIISFYDKVYGNKNRVEVAERIRKIAYEKVDMEITMQPIIRYIDIR